MTFDFERHPSIPYALTAGTSMALGFLLLWTMQTLGQAVTEPYSPVLAPRAVSAMEKPTTNNLLTAAVSGALVMEPATTMAAQTQEGQLVKRDGTPVPLEGIVGSAEEQLRSVVYPAADENLTLFVTAAGEPPAVTRLYAYDAASATGHLLVNFDAEYVKLLGMEGSRALVQYENHQGTTCDASLRTEHEFATLELSHIEDGLRRWRPSADQIIAANAEMKACVDAETAAAKKKR